MQYVPVSIFLATTMYQVTINHMIEWNREDRRRLQFQIDMNEGFNRMFISVANVTDPANTRDTISRLKTEQCIYWKGKDITLDDAKEIAQKKKVEYDRLIALSPLDRIAAIVSE